MSAHADILDRPEPLGEAVLGIADSAYRDTRGFERRGGWADRHRINMGSPTGGGMGGMLVNPVATIPIPESRRPGGIRWPTIRNRKCRRRPHARRSRSRFRNRKLRLPMPFLSRVKGRRRSGSPKFNRSRRSTSSASSKNTTIPTSTAQPGSVKLSDVSDTGRRWSRAGRQFTVRRAVRRLRQYYRDNIARAWKPMRARPS